MVLCATSIAAASPAVAALWRLTASWPSKMSPQHRYPVTEHLTDSTILVPMYHAMTEGEVDRVCEAIDEAAKSPTTDDL